MRCRISCGISRRRGEYRASRGCRPGRRPRRPGGAKEFIRAVGHDQSAQAGPRPDRNDPSAADQALGALRAPELNHIAIGAENRQTSTPGHGDTGRKRYGSGGFLFSGRSLADRRSHSAYLTYLCIVAASPDVIGSAIRDAVHNTGRGSWGAPGTCGTRKAGDGREQLRRGETGDD